MNAVSSIALSGLSLARERLGASAHNVANASTTGIHARRVDPATLDGGGVSGRPVVAPQAGVSLERELVEQRSAAYSFQANLKTVQTAHAMLGSLLDAMA